MIKVYRQCAISWNRFSRISCICKGHPRNILASSLWMNTWKEENSRPLWEGKSEFWCQYLVLSSEEKWQSNVTSLVRTGHLEEGNPCVKWILTLFFWRGGTTDFFEKLMKTLDSYPDRHNTNSSCVFLGVVSLPEAHPWRVGLIQRGQVRPSGSWQAQRTHDTLAPLDVMAETGEGKRLDSQAERPRGRSRVLTIYSGGCWAAQCLSRMHSVGRDPGFWTNHLCGLKWSHAWEQRETTKEKEWGACLVSQTAKNLPAVLETWAQSRRSLGVGNGDPLQYSCLGNPVDRGAWRARVYGVTRVGRDLATKPPPPTTTRLQELERRFGEINLCSLTALDYGAGNTWCGLRRLVRARGRENPSPSEHVQVSRVGQA